MKEKEQKAEKKELDFCLVSEVERSGEGEVSFIALRKNQRFLFYAGDLPWVELKKNDCFFAKVYFYQNTISFNPFSYQWYLVRRGIDRTVRVNQFVEIGQDQSKKPLRDNFVKKLYGLFGSNQALDVLLAVTIGEKGVLTEDTKDLFRRTGTSHLLVVSGFHVGVVYFLIHALISFLWRVSERLILFLPVQILSPSVSFLFTVWYTWLTGSALSTLRALLFVFVFSLGELLCRKHDRFQTLLISFLLISIIWPGSYFEAGFQLTFSALFGIFLVLELTEKKVFGPKIINYFIKCFLFSFAAWFFTAPLNYLWFDSFVPLAPLINTLITPIFSLVCIAGGGLVLLYAFFELPFWQEILGMELYLISIILDLLESASMSGFPLSRE